MGTVRFTKLCLTICWVLWGSKDFCNLSTFIFCLFFSRLVCFVEYWLSSWCYLRQATVCSSLLQPLECGEGMIRLSAHLHCLDHSERVCYCQISHPSELQTFYGPAFRNHVTWSHIWICDAAVCLRLQMSVVKNEEKKKSQKSFFLVNFSSLFSFQSFWWLFCGNYRIVIAKTI